MNKHLSGLFIAAVAFASSTVVAQNRSTVGIAQTSATATKASAKMSAKETKAGATLNRSLVLHEMAAARVKMKNIDGTYISIQDAAGSKGTMVIFTCNHCPWAQAWEGRITKLANVFQAKGVGAIAINANDPSDYDRTLFEKMNRMAKKKGVLLTYSPDTFKEMQRRAQAAMMRFPYVVDDTSNIARAFGATKTPEIFLFNAVGKSVFHGGVDDNPFVVAKVKERFLLDALQHLVAGQSILVPERKTVGCAIAFRKP